MFLAVACLLSCSRHGVSPEAAFENAERAFVRGQLQKSADEAKQNFEKLRNSNPQWAWRFKLLQAKAILWQGRFQDVLAVLDSLPEPAQPGIAIPGLAIRGVAHAHLQQYSDADRDLGKAATLCDKFDDPGCGEVLQGRGLLASERGNSAPAEHLYELSLAFARSHRDRFLESTSLLNLGAEALAQGHFDQALDWSQAAYNAANNVDARIVELVTQGNIGWASYRLGDSDKALQLFLAAEHSARELGDWVDEGIWLTNAGYVYMDARNFALAGQSFQSALALEQKVNSKENIYNALRVLARLSLQTGDAENAHKYAELALRTARESGNHVAELYPALVEGQVAAYRGDATTAQRLFRAVEEDPACPSFLKWEVRHSLARLYQTHKHTEEADREYRAALATFEDAREEVRHEDFHLSFLTNAAGIYDDYVHFLVERGDAAGALRWADYSRARTLAEGLGLVTSKSKASAASTLNAAQIAHHVKGTILFYWLGEKQSYLWAITAQKTQLFSLPGAAEIEEAIQRYRRALSGPQDAFASANLDGMALFRTLVSPAQALLTKGGKVFIIPDGGLNNLNFETLIVPGPTPHFWIEDAIIADAGSLRLLSAANSSRKPPARRLLLVGDSIPPSREYPELPRAAAQMESVAAHFPPDERQVLAREQATPAAYIHANLERFSYIHFVAHGTASRLSPLDSAVVLSREAAGSDTFKLYARDIIRHPLRADLVTISACYGAGERSYSGEGLVGLSWAFLRAGAHSVIAALWEATDVSTEELMARFYDELDKGASPDAALRSAKLALLHGNGFRNPFYWAPFQFYVGS